jgi:hypothetical protein
VTPPTSNGDVILSTAEEDGHTSCVIGEVSALPPLAATLQTGESLALDVDAVRFQDINICEIPDDMEASSDRRRAACEEGGLPPEYILAWHHQGLTADSDGKNFLTKF